MVNNDLRSWEEGAMNYLKIKAEKKDAYKRIVDTPLFISLLDNVNDKKILDLGCGDGELCKVLSHKGAQVMGLDGSKTMIQAAQSNYNNCEYLLCDLMNEDIPLKSSSLDIVTSKFSLMYIESVKKVANEVRRLLKDNSLFLIDIVHPFRPVIKKLTHIENECPDINDYFKEYKGVKYWGSVSYPYYYRPVYKYIKDITESGFTLLQAQEPKIDKNFLKKYHVNKILIDIPIVSLHLLFKKTK